MYQSVKCPSNSSSPTTEPYKNQFLIVGAFCLVFAVSGCGFNNGSGPGQVEEDSVAPESKNSKEVQDPLNSVGSAEAKYENVPRAEIAFAVDRLEAFISECGTAKVTVRANDGFSADHTHENFVVDSATLLDSELIDTLKAMQFYLYPNRDVLVQNPMPSDYMVLLKNEERQFILAFSSNGTLVQLAGSDEREFMLLQGYGEQATRIREFLDGLK